MVSIADFMTAEGAVKAIGQAWQKQVVEEFKQLIRDGLLGYEVIEGQHLFRSSTTDEIDIGQMVKVRLFADEKIRKLELENSRLRDKLMNLLECIEDENNHYKYKDDINKI